MPTRRTRRVTRSLKMMRSSVSRPTCSTDVHAARCRGHREGLLDHGRQLVTLPDGGLLFGNKDERCHEWYLDTQGTALREVLAVEGVNIKRTYTNDLWQIVDVFGIEAARARPDEGTRKRLVLRWLLRQQPPPCSPRGHNDLPRKHRRVTRHGINRADTGALMRCSFEETVEILLEAAAIGELDDCRGISENVMLGQMAPDGHRALRRAARPEMLDTVISDVSRMGLMPGMTPSRAASWRVPRRPTTRARPWPTAAT